MKLKPSILIAGVEILGAIAELASAALDGKPETKPDLNKFLSPFLAALASSKSS